MCMGTGSFSEIPEEIEECEPRFTLGEIVKMRGAFFKVLSIGDKDISFKLVREPVESGKTAT